MLDRLSGILLKLDRGKMAELPIQISQCTRVLSRSAQRVNPPVKSPSHTVYGILKHSGQNLVQVIPLSVWETGIDQVK